jgi:dTMP kinase
VADADDTAARYVDAIGGGVGGIGRSKLLSGAYRGLFIAQVASSTGDWIGFLAVILLAKNLGHSNADVAVGAVLSARLLPGFFFGAFATALLDRWDRKRIMVVCDIGRGCIYALIPFLHSVALLAASSFVLELLTLMWTPAKEASVPNLVRTDQLAAANSAGLTAAYGTIIPALVIFTVLTIITPSTSPAIYIDVASFFLSAFLISRLHLPRKGTDGRLAAGPPTLASTWRDAKDGWRFIGQTHKVRGVIIGFCTALIGGGMTVPLATTYSTLVLHRKSSGFGLLALALGLGVAVGVLMLSVFQKRINRQTLFPLAVAVAGASLVFAASWANLALVMLGIGLLGVCAGAVYVLGYTIVGESTSDEFRGRIFGVFYTLVRLCLLLAFTIAPFLSALLDGITYHLQRRVHGVVIHHELGNSTFHIAVPGTRVTLWLGGLIILGASWVARRDLNRD